MVVGQPQLARRAQHALALDAAQLAALISNGLPFAGSVAPTSAHGTFMPARTFGAPQTMLQRLPVPASTLQTLSRSALGCCSTAQHLAHHDAARTAARPARTPRPRGRPWSAGRRARRVVRRGSHERRAASSQGIALRCLRTRAFSELLEEAQVAVEEQAQVVDAVAQHGQALEARAEREADVALRDRGRSCAPRRDAPGPSRRSPASGPSAARCRTSCRSRPRAR